MRIRLFGVSSLTVLLMLPIFAALFAGPMVQPAQAADACQGDTEAIEWNQTMQRMAEVPHWSGSYYPYYDDDMYYEENSFGESQVEPAEPDVPEEPWMYQQNDWNLPPLDPLETSHYTTMLIGNDSVGALRVNLSSNYRTTVCITLQDLNSNPVEGDVYLLTTSEYESYVTSYECAHTQSWYCWGEGDVEEALSDIPPEWRSWNPLGWKSYRDAHEYERVSSVNFALNLDGPEVYTSLWGESNWQDFYIIVDAWDNIHDNDAEAPGVTVAADVTVVTTSRSLVLPSWTVALAFMGLILGAMIAPFVANAKYMKAGMVPKTASEVLVPSLEQRPDLPQVLPPMPLPQPMPIAAAEQQAVVGALSMQDASVQSEKSYDVDPFEV